MVHTHRVVVFVWEEEEGCLAWLLVWMCNA